MSKTPIRENFRVEVEPRSPGDFGFAHIGHPTQSEEDWERDCEEVARQIRRHVDGLPSHGDRGVRVLWDTRHVCSHCGSDWGSETDEHNDGCCQEDMKNVPEDVA